MIPASYKASLERVISAPDTFKGTLSAEQAAQAIANGIKHVLPDCQVDLCPLADGGEGSLTAIHSTRGGTFCEVQVLDPIGRPCQARWLHVPEEKLGLIELAEASGLMRVADSEPRALLRTTYGTGQLLNSAIDAGCENLVLFLGGSATIDCGIGMAQALGVKLFDSAGQELPAPLPPHAYQSISRVDNAAIKHRWQSLTVACDVTNPLIGERGAAHVYAPQKGATPEEVTVLNAALAHLASLFPNVDPYTKRAGAAGGAGFGALAVLGGALVSGIDTILEIVHFQQRCRNASLVITGEGQLDTQSRDGKACYGVSLAAEALNTPTIAVVGSTAPGFESMLRSNGGPLTDYINLSEYVGATMARNDPAHSIALSIEQWLKQDLGEP